MDLLMQMAIVMMKMNLLMAKLKQMEIQMQRLMHLVMLRQREMLMH
jgi:hypothetical protein